MNAYLDTVAALRLASGDLRKIGKEAQQAMNRYDLLISPMVLLELQYAFEIDRCKHPAETVFMHLQRTVDVQICTLPFDRVAKAAVREGWTRDAFDRLIVSHARCAGNAYLITSDELIPEHYAHAIW